MIAFWALCALSLSPHAPWSKRSGFSFHPSRGACAVDNNDKPEVGVGQLCATLIARSREHTARLSRGIDFD